MGGRGWHAMIAVLLAGAFLFPGVARAQTTPGQVRERGEQCLRERNYVCAERAFTAYRAQRSPGRPWRWPEQREPTSAVRSLVQAPSVCCDHAVTCA